MYEKTSDDLSSSIKSESAQCSSPDDSGKSSSESKSDSDEESKNLKNSPDQTVFDKSQQSEESMIGGTRGNIVNTEFIHRFENIHNRNLMNNHF